MFLRRKKKGRKKERKTARSVHLEKTEILGTVISDLSMGSTVMFPREFS